ncbi:MAG: ubiquinol-cytochrome c reductase iron-sulfur subunit [Gammaproteobacteria bacterium]
MNKAGTRKRQFLTISTSFVAGVGVATAAIPFVQSWSPSARARATGAPVVIDVSKLLQGELLTVQWQGKPVWVMRRTSDNIANLEDPAHQTQLRDADSLINQQPEYAKNTLRSLRPEIFVAVALCTHLGCIPNLQREGTTETNHSRFFCACHGSIFDLAGRVVLNVPASSNLIVPPHRYITANILEIGVDNNTVS